MAGRKVKVFLISVIAAGILFSYAGVGSAKKVTLTLVWHAGICAETLLDIAKDWERISGNKVVGSLVPYGPQWHDKVAAEFAAHGSGFDLACWDSQSVAEFAGGGHCVLLNPLIEKSEILHITDFSPVALARYGEYPDGSGNYYAFAANQDCLGLIYRKDLFEDPEEKAKFFERYRYELDIPKTYRQLRDIAEFFTRPPKLYGFAQYGGREYDYCTSMSNTFIWAFGGELWNPRTKEVRGYLDSPASIQGVEFYVDLFKFCPPGSETWGFDEVNTAMQQGRAAMAMQWFYFFGSMLDPTVSKIYDKVGFAILPGEYGMDGKYRREFSMGGQGIGINKYSKHVDEAWKFIEWYQQHDQQMKYARNCQTGRLSVMNSPEWLELNPYNKLFRVALEWINDYWHIPEYAILLDIMQEEVNLAVVGKKTAEQALKDCTDRHERTLSRAGYEIGKTEHVDVPDNIVH